MTILMTDILKTDIRNSTAPKRWIIFIDTNYKVTKSEDLLIHLQSVRSTVPNTLLYVFGKPV